MDIYKRCGREVHKPYKENIYFIVMKKGIMILIIVIVVLIIAGGVFGYLYFTGAFNNHSRFQNRNFQLNQSEIDKTNAFFDSSPSESDVTSFCNEYRADCFYYCRTVNPQSSICTQMMNFTRNGNYPRQGNYTRRQGGQGMPPQPPQNP